MSRIACGTTSPTNPIVPLTDTDAAVNSVAVRERDELRALDRRAEIRRRRLADREQIERARQRRRARASAGTRHAARMPTLRHDAFAWLPIIQKIADRTDSVSANVRIKPDDRDEKRAHDDAREQQHARVERAARR